MLLVGTFRDAEARTPPLANTLATLARTADLERLALPGSRVGEVGDYVAAVVGDDADPALADSLHDRTAGNPFFVAELVRLLQDEGKLGDRRRRARRCPKASATCCGRASPASPTKRSRC